MKNILLIAILFVALPKKPQAQVSYFPPINNNLPWETVSPISLGWCNDKINALYTFLQQENTKGFIVLKDGKIVLEKYFGNFTQDSSWYWASAGKTLTAFLIGQAQEEGFLNINNTTSTYLGNGWTNCTPQQESNIKVWNQLTMTSGLNDGVPDNHCTIDTCLQFLAPAGTRWAYHNAPYTLLEKVITNATGQNINSFTQTRLKNATGMTGLWYTIDYNNVFISKPRSMARFGLLIQNKGIWNNDTLLHDAAYVQQMTNTSQSLNLGYGYLWWLNGKNSFMVPTLQNVFPGSYAPNAALDMYSGLGKNGQIVSVAPGQKLVVVRMGEQATSTSSDITIQLCDQIWEKLNEAMYCNNTFTFTGNGNWTDTSNWSNSMIPPPILPAGSKIIVDPIAGGECVLNTIQQIKTGASISVNNGKKFRIVGNLIQQ